MALLLQARFKTISKKKTADKLDDMIEDSQTERDYLGMYYTRTATAVYKVVKPSNISAFNYYKRREIRKEYFKQAGLNLKYSNRTKKPISLKEAYFRRQLT